MELYHSTYCDCMYVKATIHGNETILEHSYKRGGYNEAAGYTAIESNTQHGQLRFEILATQNALIWRGSYSTGKAFTIECNETGGSLVLLIALSPFVTVVHKHNILSLAAGKGELLLLAYDFPYLLDSGNDIIFRTANAVTETIKQLVAYPASDISLKKYVYHKSEELYLLLRQYCEEEKKKASLPDAIIEKLRRTEQLVRDHPDKNYTVNELCAFSELNSKYFSTYFKSFYGKTIHQYITAVKMEAAQRMIALQNTSLQDIAFALGYSSASNFSRAYKKYFGFSPGKRSF